MEINEAKSTFFKPGVFSIEDQITNSVEKEQKVTKVYSEDAPKMRQGCLISWKAG